MAVARNWIDLALLDVLESSHFYRTSEGARFLKCEKTWNGVSTMRSVATHCAHIVT